MSSIEGGVAVRCWWKLEGEVVVDERIAADCKKVGVFK